ncbi:hypothetical protein B0T21DRAFT_370082 [Apiosordaria backusii]|uniref:Uncharacterized protein n=1 Tax=Apiosordaria backusii TaxID=314023 RepID=A0AA40B7Q2_9PEZI|nr:hypothetical protein B0T21DRAFT_370082 [Apiosordaria backusii]
MEPRQLFRLLKLWSLFHRMFLFGPRLVQEPLSSISISKRPRPRTHDDGQRLEWNNANRTRRSADSG